MDIYLVIYLLGIIASLFVFYLNLDKGEDVTLIDLCIAMLSATFSWVTLVLFLVYKFSDKVVFRKK